MRKIPSWEYEVLPGESEARFLLRLVLIDLQTLAADAETCIHAYPSLVQAADEVAEDLDTHLIQFEQAGPSGLASREQLDRIRAVDAKLGEMSGPQDPELWTEKGLRTRPEWAVVRRLARDAVDAMGYEPESPPPFAGFYLVARASRRERFRRWLSRFTVRLR